MLIYSLLLTTFTMVSLAIPVAVGIRKLTAAKNSSTLRRLASDHAALHKAELPPYYLFPANSSMPEDLTQLTILLTGPQGTPYEGGLWKLHLKIPHDYPISPPKAFFKTKIWHPNVEESNGSVCLDTLKRDWQSKLTLRDILIVSGLSAIVTSSPSSATDSEIIDHILPSY